MQMTNPPGGLAKTIFDFVFTREYLYSNSRNVKQVEDSSVDIKLMVLAHSDPVSGLEAELKYDMRRPATGKPGGCPAPTELALVNLHDSR